MKKHSNLIKQLEVLDQQLVATSASLQRACAYHGADEQLFLRHCAASLDFYAAELITQRPDANTRLISDADAFLDVVATAHPYLDQLADELQLVDEALAQELVGLADTLKCVPPLLLIELIDGPGILDQGPSPIAA